MMELILSVIRDIFLVTGSIAVLIGAFGVLRLPELFCRIHAAGITDTAGAGLIITGLMIESGFTLVSLKLLVIFVFLFFTSPTSSHALAKSAIHGNVLPVTDLPKR